MATRKVIELEDITKEEFQAFEDVRVSGLINMWDAKTGCRLTGLSWETWAGVIKYYSQLRVKYPGVRKEE